MQGQSGRVSKLKRQLSFLKSIDQKLEGLRRENERLRRIVSNPRVRFSRSSLGGLYRIVNSMVSAGPMYGLDSIELWAERAREWLVELGKRGSGPSNDELDWLAETISQLGDLRDDALATVEAAIRAAKDEDLDDSEVEDGDVVPDDEGGSSDTVPSRQDVPGSRLDNARKGDATATGAAFPFSDEPEGRSIAEASFWKKGERRPGEGGFRDRTSTIPLAIDDLTSITPPAAGTALAPPPFPARAPGFWKPLAIFSLLGFLAMGGLLAKAKQAEALRERAWEARLARAEAAAARGVQGAAREETPARQQDAAAAAGPLETRGDAQSVAADPSRREGEAAAAAPTKPTSKSETASESGGDRKARRPEKQPGREQPKRTKKPAPPEKAPDEVVGTLVIKSPDSGDKVLVTVDGISRGRTPVRLKLSPGLHEVVFLQDGKKSIRMVPIRPNATKTVTAVIPN